MQRLSLINKESIKEQIYKYLNKSPEARFVHRIHALLLLIDNMENNCSNNSELFDNSPRNVSNWIHKVNKSNDIEVLRDVKKQGRPPRLNKEQENTIKAAVLEHPSESGIEANLWDGNTLSLFVKTDYKIELKVRQCQRLFRKLGFTLKRGRMIATTSTYFNAKSFKSFLEHLLKRVKPKGKKILLVLDNAKYHKAKELARYIKSIEDKLIYKFLPPYFPDLYPIETQWRETRKNSTHKQYFASFKEQRAAILGYWRSKPGSCKKDIYSANIYNVYYITNY